MKKVNIYLDDIRTPVDPEWIVVRSYDEFVNVIQLYTFDQIESISLDHDLGDTAMDEYYNNVSPNYVLDYDNIKEKTGYDCAKWLTNHYMYMKHKYDTWCFPLVYTHSANPIGAANIMGYINNFLKNNRKPQTCIHIGIKHNV